ncbi:hypothetical protein AAHB33_05130 [Paenarthrobacter sp. S56]|uniref:hypothetical protein n=1 Tax=Paenarthrobacter sp. S56 TaxID=3138179 RepID=UPI00321A98F9
MKVIYTQVAQSAGAPPFEGSGWLELDTEYTVTSILAYPNGRVEIQVVADAQRSMAWVDSRAVMTTDETIPESWEARVGDGGVLEFAPPRWLVPGFWEDYYDGEPTAAQAVKEELDKILGRQTPHGMPDLNRPMTSQELQSAGAQVAVAQGTDRWKGLMLVLLHHIKEIATPLELQPVLATAESYWSLGKGTPEALERVRVSCWSYLNEFESHAHLIEAGPKFARALLCILEPLGDENARSDTADWFAGVVWDIW